MSCYQNQWRDSVCQLISFVMVKFIYSEKATKFCEISTLLLTGTTQDKSNFTDRVEGRECCIWTLLLVTIPIQNLQLTLCYIILNLIVNSSRSVPSGHHQMLLFFCAQSKTEIFLKKCLINKWGGKFANRVRLKKYEQGGEKV